MKDETVVSIAKETEVSPGNVLLSYHVARGNPVLAKSVSPLRNEENLGVVRFKEQQTRSLEALSKNGVRRFVYPEFGVNFGFPDEQ